MENVMLIVGGTLVSLLIMFAVFKQSHIPRRRVAGNNDSGAVYAGSGDGCDSGDAGCGDGGGGGGGD